MAYVSKDDIIAFIDNEINFIQGNSQTYEITLYKDFIGSPLNLNQPTSFNVALYVNENRALQYSSPRTLGVSDILNIDNTNDTGTIQFEIDVNQSIYLTQGDIYAEVSIIFENMYPQPKSYVLPKIKIGTAINNPEIEIGNSDSGNVDSNNQNVIPSHNGTFNIEATDGSNPTTAGFVSMSSNKPNLVDSIIFKNLDAKGIRLTALENFLIKRISTDNINGVITLLDTESTNMYAIYKIDSWERVDITSGNGEDDDSDGIKINVSLEAQSTGPGVTKTIWSVGQKITFELDAHGITGSSILPDGILTYVDKAINPIETSGNYSSTGIIMTYSPYQDSYVSVEVNGISVDLGDGVRDTDSYFSGDGGNTPTSIEEIRAGDQLYWNGQIAGFDLVADDEINLIYEAKAEDLR